VNHVRERGWWYDVEWVSCDRCRGTGDPRNNVCKLCAGTGRITKELDRRWCSRGVGESVTAPDADLWNQGRLHAAGRERHQGGELA
jgi:hypothetical protein